MDTPNIGYGLRQRLPRLVQRRLNELTSLLINACGMLFHSWRNVAWSSLMFVGCLRQLWIRLPNSSQRCSMGARSGERAGQSSTWIPLAWRKFWVRKALWARALSCWDIERKWNHMRPKHLTDIASRCNSTSRTITLKVQSNRLRSLTICDASPYHYVCSTPSVSLHDALVGIPFTCTSIHTETAIGHRHDQRRSVIRHWKAYHASLLDADLRCSCTSVSVPPCVNLLTLGLSRDV